MREGERRGVRRVPDGKRPHEELRGHDCISARRGRACWSGPGYGRPRRLWKIGVRQVVEGQAPRRRAGRGLPGAAVPTGAAPGGRCRGVARIPGNTNGPDIPARARSRAVLLSGPSRPRLYGEPRACGTRRVGLLKAEPGRCGHTAEFITYDPDQRIVSGSGRQDGTIQHPLGLRHRLA